MIDEVEDYAILLLNREGNIQNWNKGAQKIKGYTSAEILGKNFRLFYTKEDQEGGLPERLITEAVTHGKANHEGWRVRKDGTRFWGSVVITALHDNENSIIGFSKVTRDLTQRKLNEDAILEKSRLFEANNRELEKMNQELSSFVYVSSHDLQEPLRKIQTFSSYLLQFENAHLSDKGKDYLKRMDATAGRMKVLIHDLLVYSRTSNTDAPAEAIPFEVFLQGAKDELKEIIEEKKAVVESGPLPRLRVIAFQFQQLFTNIVSNSLKYAKKGVAPHIVIAADIVDGSLVADKEARADALYHHISFADNGIGFAPANNHKIFEIFKRLHTRDEYEGTGIGLSICKKIVENHAGFITAQGEPQKGAVIHVYLPV
ncbi:MAG TPA: ATP-binding protein, partial [Chitinophagaceae bacterium]|nr:ATP-binding protein [Chitinophagaceae bacterium]